MMLKNLNTLHQLLASYFHQDWPDEFEDDSSALQSIIAGEPREKLAAGAKEIEALLSLVLSEHALKVILINDLGCYFDPASEGMSCETWLKKVCEKFASPLKTT